MSELARLEREWVPYTECPCGCGVVAAKLTRVGHVVACACASCRGRRNRAKGHRAQAKMHRALGGQGFTPHDEESGRPYLVEVCVLPESKTGQQVPASWRKFIGLDWTRRAFSQSERAVPAGSGVVPAIVIDGRYLIADLKPKPGEQL